MTVRWITEYLGTSPWREELELAPDSTGIVDVRLLRDTTGNSPILIREKIAEASNYLKRGKPVVVCCDYGVSRSNAIAAAVLAEHMSISFGESLQRVIAATGETGIKIDFVEDLRKVLDTKQLPAFGARALVLGREGFIGHSVSQLIDPVSPFAETGRDQSLIGNPVLLDAAMDEIDADRIMFCWHPPRLDTNLAAGQLITALRNVLEVCRVRRAGLIFLSGQQVFAGHRGHGHVPFREADAPQPEWSAGDGLFLGENLVDQYGKRHDLPMLVVRSSHVYGQGDERPGLIKTFVQKALARQNIVTHHYQNGVPSIDFIHVRDLARALQLADKKKLTGILHIASGNLITTDELARLIVNKADSSSTVARIEMPGNCRMVQLDSMIARTILEWQPVVDLETGLTELIDYTRPSAS